MTISEFIEGRGISYDTVRRYLNRNKEKFKGHIGKKGKIVLDEYAVELLNEKYPLPQPIEMVQDPELLRKYNAVLEQLTMVQQQLVEAAPKIAAAEYNERLLDDQQKRIEELEKELEVERSKSWFDKLLGK